MSELIAARVDGLPRHAQATLQAVSVFGAVAPFDALEAAVLLLDNDRLDEALLLLDERALLRLEDEVVAFSHELVRDVVYAAIPSTVRSALHASFGEWLGSSGALAPMDEGHHWERAGEHDLASERLFAAGELARRAFDDAGACDWYGRAVDAARRALRDAVTEDRLSARHPFTPKNTKNAGVQVWAPKP